MGVEKRSLTFGITGEFITKVAREWFFMDEKPYSVVEELLLSCMCGTDTPEGELKLMAQDVLIGKAEFRGNSWDGSFCYAKLDAPAPVNIFDEYCKLRLEMKRIKEENSRISGRYNSMCSALQLWQEDCVEDAVYELDDDSDLKDLLLKLLSRYGEVEVRYGPGGYKEVVFDGDDDPVEIAPASTGEPILDSFMAQQHIEAKHKDNYGWLEPDGTFHPVPWCDHQEFASEVIRERGWWDEFDRWDDETSIYCNGDFLTRVKGWVLLHNPGRGVAFVTRDEGKRLTKAQREFLFNYYFDRGEKAKAAEFLEDT